MYVVTFHKETFLALYAILTIITYIVYRQKQRTCKFWVIGVFIFYILSVIQIVFLPIYVYRDEALHSIQLEVGEYVKYYQLVPFKTIRNTLINSGWKVQIIGNIILLLPIPLFFGFMKKNIFSVKNAFLIGFVTSCSIEFIQLLISFITGFPSRIADIDDLLLNTIGVIIGILLYIVILKIHPLYDWINKLVNVNSDL